MLREACYFFRVLMYMNTTEKIFLKTFGFYIVLIIMKMDSKNHSLYQYLNLDCNIQI